MKANELRIGNWVYQDYVKENVTVSGLYESSDECWYNIHNGESRGPIQSFKPIPLTEEWLIKFGFEDDNGEIELQLGNYTGAYLWFNNVSKQLRLVSGDGKFLSHDKLKYVHQLQNLYFALTGEELTIKQINHEKEKSTTS